jgi:glucosylceramidase
VVAGLTQVKAGDRWIGYSLPYGAELLARSATSLSRAGWTVEADGGQPVQGESVGSLVDGDPRTRWSSGTGQGPTLSLTMHLGGPATFSEIALDTAQSPGDYLRRYLVEVSDDGTSWNRIARGPGRPTLAGTMSIMVPRTTAAHVRIRSDEVSGSWWSVHELTLRLSEGPASLPLGPALVTDTGELADGTEVSGHYNSGAGPAVVPWSVPGFDYSYRLPPRAAVTFAVVAASAAERVGPTLSRRGPGR